MSLNVGEIQFYDNYIQGLSSGVYTITLNQAVTGVGTGSGDNTQTYSKTQQFVVQAPQVSIDPGEIHAFFPPAYSSGQFAENLPYIILNGRALPWERNLSGQAATVPWMALVIFTEDELLGAVPQNSQNSQSQAQGMSREPSHSGSFVSTCTVAELLQSDPQVLKPQIDAQSLDPNQNCQYIDITSATFRAVVPTIAELPYLSHVRHVNTGNTDMAGINDKGWFSVVMSNRFPAPAAQSNTAGLRNVVHLVSLEGYENYLTANPAPFPKMTASGKTNKDKYIRLVSLANWTFTCLAESGQSFAGIIKGLITNQQGQPLSADALKLKLPVAAPNNPNDTSPTTVAQNRLSSGFVALNYHTLSGEDTFSWYRGALVPAPTHYTAKTAPFLSASGAMIYDKTTGIFDHSLAAAWQLGRNLALASQSFATAFLTYRREARLVVNQWMANQAAQQAQGSDELIATLQMNPSNTQARQWMTAKMSNTIAELSAMGITREQIKQSRASMMQNKSRVKADNYAVRTQQFMARDDVQDALTQQMEDALRPVAAWIARLGLLYSIPFDHMVPDPAMLPVESLRFFYIDQNWLDALMDGVLSTGIQSGFDTVLLQAMYTQIRQAVYQAALDYRNQITEGTDINAGTAETPEIRSGFLLRSALVSGWPGLIVQAFQSNTQLKTLRMERVAPDVLLCIFLGVPDKMKLSLPQQNLSFGVLDGGAIDLRYVSGSSIGMPLSPTATLQIYDPNGSSSQPFLRAGGRRVLNINPQSGTAVNSLILALQQGLHLNGLTTSQFVIQMIKSSEYQEFDA